MGYSNHNIRCQDCGCRVSAALSIQNELCGQCYNRRLRDEMVSQATDMVVR